MQKRGSSHRSLALLAAAWIFFLPFSAFAQSDASGAERPLFPFTFQAGAGAWGGYTLGYLQEKIYVSVPFDGFCGGADLDIRAILLDLYGVQLGARGDLRVNLSSNADVSGLEFDMAADALIGFDYIPRLTPYIFGGITLNNFGASYGGGEWGSQVGFGLHYGAAAFYDIFEFNMSGFGHAVVSAGAEFLIGHIFCMDMEWFYVNIIYNTKQLLIPVRISISLGEGL
jgi:hypothetical protein